MRKSSWISCAAISIFLIASLMAACRAQQPQAEYRPTATVKDLMDGMVDPSADVLWNSVATIVSAAGTEERAPHTDEDWANVRHSAVQLVEATNLLLIPGRHVAKAGEKAENQDVELSPEEIQKLIDEDRQSWTKLVHGLHDAAVPALKATEARDAQALLNAGEFIDTACETCHLKYWYPLSKQEEAKKTGAASPKKP